MGKGAEGLDGRIRDGLSALGVGIFIHGGVRHGWMDGFIFMEIIILCVLFVHID